MLYGEAGGGVVPVVVHMCETSDMLACMSKHMLLLMGEGVGVVRGGLGGGVADVWVMTACLLFRTLVPILEPEKSSTQGGKDFLRDDLGARRGVLCASCALCVFCALCVVCILYVSGALCVGCLGDVT